MRIATFLILFASVILVGILSLPVYRNRGSKPAESGDPKTGQVEEAVQPSENPAPPPETTIAPEKIELYASSFALDRASAALVAETVGRFKEAFSSKDVAVATALLLPHVKALEQAMTQKEVYSSSPKDADVLPEWFHNQLKWSGSRSLDVEMMSKGYLGLEAGSQKDQIILLECSAFVGKEGPNAIADIFSNSMKHLPTPADGMIYLALNNGLADRAAYDGRTGNEDDPEPNVEGSGAVWKMAEALNPVYRYQAVQQGWRINKPERLSFYAKYVNEKDEMIKRAALSGIERIETGNALQLLHQFEYASKQQGQNESAQAAREAIDRISKKLNLKLHRADIKTGLKLGCLHLIQSGKPRLKKVITLNFRMEKSLASNCAFIREITKA